MIADIVINGVTVGYITTSGTDERTIWKCCCRMFNLKIELYGTKDEVLLYCKDILYDEYKKMKAIFEPEVDKERQSDERKNKSQVVG